jgi:hypothetical protein
MSGDAHLEPAARRRRRQHRHEQHDPCPAPLGPDAGVATTRPAVHYPDALVTRSPFDRVAMTIPGVVSNRSG